MIIRLWGIFGASLREELFVDVTRWERGLKPRFWVRVVWIVVERDRLLVLIVFVVTGENSEGSMVTETLKV